MAKKDMTLEEKLNEAIVKDGPYEVPGKWINVKLGAIAKWGSGGTPSRNHPEYYEGKIPWIKTGELNNGYINGSEEKITDEAIRKSSAKIFKKGSVLLAMYGATIGKVAILGVDATTNQACAAAECYEKIIDNKYLFYYLLSQKENFIDLGKGGAQPNISQAIIKECGIPIPPLKEQQRIVDRIESLFEKLDKSKELIDEARDGFEKRKAAILEKAFRGELTEKWREEIKANLGEWEEKEFGKLGELERGRSRHRPRNAPELFGGEHPFIQTGDVANAKVYIKEHRQTLSEFGLKQSRLFPKGTLCITIAANIGDVAILSYDCCFPDSVVGFTPNNNIDSKYIYYYMTVLKKEIESNAPATAQKNINLKILNDVKIKMPSLSEQKEIVRILDKLFEEESTIEELTQLEEQIELIKKSILAKAFRGELGTNCEEDESVLELLKEILSEN